MGCCEGHIPLSFLNEFKNLQKLNIFLEHDDFFHNHKRSNLKYISNISMCYAYKLKNLALFELLINYIDQNKLIKLNYPSSDLMIKLLNGQLNYREKWNKLEENRKLVFK